GLEVRQSVLPSQLLRVFEARRADVDADNVRLRPAESVVRPLPGAAAGDQNIEIGAIRRVGPEQVMLGPMTIGILPFLSRPIEVGDGWRIWVPGVEVGYRVTHIRPRVPDLLNRHRRPWPSRSDFAALSREPDRC